MPPFALAVAVAIAVAIALAVAVAAFLRGREGGLRELPPPALPTPRPSRPTRGAAAERAAVARPHVAIVVRRDRPAVLLVHGLFGFDAIGVAGARVEYFRGAVEALRRHGIAAHAVRLAPAGPVGLRARQLARHVAHAPARRVALVAHSLGGLDARWAVARLGIAPRVAAVVTVGAPHRGTPLARVAAGLMSAPGVAAAVAACGLDPALVRALAPESMRRFNERVPDVPGVHYASIVGAVGDGGVPQTAIIGPVHAWLGRTAGPNDGLVPAASQRWGEVVAEIAADHWAQIGWSSRFDASATWEAVARAVRGAG